MTNDTKTTEKKRPILCKQQVLEYMGSVITSDGKLDLERAKRRQKAVSI